MGQFWTLTGTGKRELGARMAGSASVIVWPRETGDSTMKAFRRRIQDSTEGPATYIAKDSKISGTLTGKGAYVFCGEVDGDCDIDGPVTLADSGRWKGTLKGTDVVIAGHVDGDVIAEHRVEIAGTARVAGSLSGLSIAVAEGAVIEGEIKVLSGEKPTAFSERRSVTAEADSTAA